MKRLSVKTKFNLWLSLSLLFATASTCFWFVREYAKDYERHVRVLLLNSLEHSAWRIEAFAKSVEWANQRRPWFEDDISNHQPDLIYARYVTGSEITWQNVLGDSVGEVVPEDFNAIMEKAKHSEWVVWQYAGRNYFVRYADKDSSSGFKRGGFSDADHVVAWKIEPDAWENAIFTGDGHMVIVMNQTGQLIYASDNAFDVDDVESQRMVQRFIESNLTKLSFDEKVRGEEYLSGFHEVGGTNLVVFHRFRKADAYLPAKELILKLLGAVTASVLFILVLMQLPLISVDRALRLPAPVPPEPTAQTKP